MLNWLWSWTLPGFGTAVLYAVLVAAGYTFSVSLAAARGRPRLLQSARLGSYGTCALIALGVLVLAYAFVTHDFRIRYVSRYSDRSMPTSYLLTALWGGQDGSLLWWLFLLSLYVAACTRWMKGKYRELQPYVIATLMAVISFFGVLMLFTANPFETNFSGARVDGEGLNPLLQNYYMIIHPPSLYTGFVGCTIPFAFAVAALVTKRLDNEWVHATRKWMLFAWLFLSIGNALGMLWAYEELGWGGYWAWDPVENAACIPWFTASAYVHSTMIQERRNMLKVWNVVLICLTFLLTIYGTFLTRSGLIASVHSFAKSDIGGYFVSFMGLIVAVSAGLIVWRLPQLRSQNRIEHLVSREAAFLVNNWAFLGICVFITTLTSWPLLSEALLGETVTFGPPFYNRWIAPLGLLLLLLMGVGPLFGWRKTSGVSLRRAFAVPVAAMLAMMIVHLFVGESLSFPAIIEAEPASNPVGAFFATLASAFPWITIGLVAFNLAVVFQEFQRGVAARRKNSSEGFFTALGTLVARSRRRYGGYIVHVGVAMMFLGFCGKAWNVEAEASLLPGEKVDVGAYTLTYEQSRMELSRDKREIYADITVEKNGSVLGTVSPAKFIYMNGMPSSEVSIIRGLHDDFYSVLGTVNPETKRGTFRFHINPLVTWIWLGVVILIGGASVSLWPEVRFGELGAWSYVRGAAGAATSVMLVILLANGPARAMTHSFDGKTVEHWRGSQALAAEPERASVAESASVSGGELGRAFGAIGLGLLAGAVLRRRRWPA